MFKLKKNEGGSMKKILRLTMVLSVLVFCGHDLLAINIHYQVDFASRYIWRGFDLNPYRKPVIQPSLALGLGSSGLSINLWSSISFVSKESNEVNLAFSYHKEIRDTLSITAGLIHYSWYFIEDFRFGDDTSHEIFVSVGLPHFMFQPTLALYYDFTVGDGFYGQFKAGYAIGIRKNLAARLYSSLGYNGGQWLAEGTDPGFSDLNLGLSLCYSVGPFLAKAFANYTAVLLRAISRENHFWFGFSFVYNRKGGSK